MSKFNWESRSEGMKVLVTFAVPTEFAAWRRRHDFRQVSAEPFSQYVADIEGTSVRVLLTGIGTAAAAQALRVALESPADLCISSGFAGALRRDLRVGEIAAARLVRRADRDMLVAGDRELLAAAADAHARQVDRFLTTDHMVLHASEKYALVDEADAVEMESFAILAEAARHGVRAVAVRAVSDAAETSLPFDFDKSIDDRGRIRLGSLIAGVARRPHRIPALLRLARDCRMAAQQLADFLDVYLTVLHARLDLSQSEMVAAL
jgi:adenosylhomocysteine nucleosidase